MRNKLFQNIAGYDCVKQELIKIYNWYTNKQILSNENIELPRGILLFGPPGNGKSLFVQEYIKAMGCPSAVLLAKSSNINEEIHKCFKKASKSKMSIIVIDELDKICNNPITLKVLQNEIDVVPRGKIIVLATSNHIAELPNSIVRQGRFDRKILITDPDKEDSIAIYKFYLNKLGINCKSLDLEHISSITKGSSCADIKAICNNAYLEGQQKITTRDIEIAYDRLDTADYRNLKPITYKNYHVAIHEAGHAVMAMRFSKDIRLYNSKFTSTGGETIHYAINDLEDSIEKRLEKIQISVAGYIAEELFFKKHDIGSVLDIDKAFYYASNLIQRTCCKSLEHFVGKPQYDRGRPDTDAHHRINEKQIWKLLRKQIKLARKYLKSQKDNIAKFADFMYKNGEVTLHDVNKIFKNGDIKEMPVRISMLPRYASIKED